MIIYKEHLNEMKKKVQLLDEEWTMIVSLINCERQLLAYEKDVFSCYWYNQYLQLKLNDKKMLLLELAKLIFQKNQLTADPVI